MFARVSVSTYILYFRRFNAETTRIPSSDKMEYRWTRRNIVKFNPSSNSIMNIGSKFLYEFSTGVLKKPWWTLWMVFPSPFSLSSYIFSVYTSIYPRHAWNEIRIIHRDHEKCYSMKSVTLVCMRFYFETAIINSLIILWNVRETAKSRRIWLKSSRTISRDFQARLFVTFDRNYESGRKPVRLNGAYNFIRATRRTRI